VTWLPYYSGEKRAACYLLVNISDIRVGSLFISHPNIGVAMNQPAMKMLEPTVRTVACLW